MIRFVFYQKAHWTIKRTHSFNRHALSGSCAKRSDRTSDLGEPAELLKEERGSTKTSDFEKANVECPEVTSPKCSKCFQRGGVGKGHKRGWYRRAGSGIMSVI